MPTCRADAWTEDYTRLLSKYVEGVLESDPIERGRDIAPLFGCCTRIFHWDAGDFQAAGGGVGFIDKYRKPPLAPDAKVSYLSYDWSLNNATH